MSAEHEELARLAHALHRASRRWQRRGHLRSPAPTPGEEAAPLAEGATAPVPSGGAPPGNPGSARRAPAATATAADAPPPAAAPVEEEPFLPAELREESAAPSPAAAGRGSEGTPEAVATQARSASDLDSLGALAGECRACGLCETRTQVVFADGRGPARVMFVGEAPGYHEDQQGTPFVGPAGELLTKIITSGMGLAREEVYIANVLKCRPPENRDPTAREKELCTPWLDRQIELVDPEVLIPLGRHAAGHLLASDAPMGKLRGRVHAYKGRKVVPTYHPAFLLRSPHMKKACWEDIQLAMAELGLQPPG